MKKTLLFSLCSASALMAGYSEHAYLYKDARIMGMGGANVAVGGYSTSVFHNPAGILNIKKSHGLEVELLGLGVQASSGIQDFVDDIDTADGDTQAVSDVLKKYSGDHFNIGLSNYSSVTNNGDSFAWSVGVLAAVDGNFIAHGNGGANALLETHSRGYGGLVAAVASSFENVGPGTLDVGIGVKYISQQSYEGGIGVSEIVDNQDDLGTYMQDKYERKSSGYGIDLGLNYKFFPESSWHPAVGISILNIGNMKMDNNYGKQPMTVNLGASVSPEVAFLEHFILAVDYVDLLNANETRFYNFTQSAGVVTSVTHQDFEEADFMKRLRLGVSAGLFDNSWFMMTLNGGLYQGNYTFGIDLQATLIKLGFATYAEEIGPKTGDLTDRRYMVNLGIGW